MHTDSHLPDNLADAIKLKAGPDKNLGEMSYEEKNVR